MSVVIASPLRAVGKARPETTVRPGRQVGVEMSAAVVLGRSAAALPAAVGTRDLRRAQRTWRCERVYGHNIAPSFHYGNSA